MVIDIRAIPEGHSELSRETDLGTFKDELPLLCGKVSCNAAIDRTDPLLAIHLKFHCIYELRCSRCLEPFCFPVDGDVRIVIQEQQGRYGVVFEKEEGEESVDYIYDSRNLTLDLTPSIYEEIMVAFPLKPLCSETCKGIDNYTDTAISRQSSIKDAIEVDPRWEGLKKLKDK
jgi:uncharacterized protein